MKVKNFHTVLHLMYAKPTVEPPHWKRTPYHLGKWFDIVVLILFVISALGYFLV